jgi:hypothetical protein
LGNRQTNTIPFRLNGNNREFLSKAGGFPVPENSVQAALPATPLGLIVNVYAPSVDANDLLRGNLTE